MSFLNRFWNIKKKYRNKRNLAIKKIKLFNQVWKESKLKLKRMFKMKKQIKIIQVYLRI